MWPKRCLAHPRIIDNGPGLNVLNVRWKGILGLSFSYSPLPYNKYYFLNICLFYMYTE